MSRQRFFPQQSDTLQHVLSADDYIVREIGRSASPFIPTPWFRVFQRWVARMALALAEVLTGVTFLVENEERELASFGAENRRLLSTLLRRKIVTSWDCGSRAVDKPGIAFCSLTVGSIKDRDGYEFVRGGELQGQGTGVTLDEALMVALAETIERIAVSEWQSERFVCKTVGELENARTDFFAKQYIEEKSIHDVAINWIPARSAITGREVQIPASMAFLYYHGHHFHEPLFWHTTSNGCAAHTTHDRATMNALLELFERDGLLMYWLNRLAPRRIDLATIGNKHIAATVAQLQQYDITLHILDCSTEYSIPTLVGVLVDERTGGIEVNAASDLDPMRALQKVVDDSSRWGLGYTQNDRAYEGDYSSIKSMDERRRLWHSGRMRSEIEFFLQGEIISFAEYVRSYANVAPGLGYIIQALKTQGSDAFVLDVTNPLAREAGLRVVRAIIPDLVPMYFIEGERPLEVPRLYRFAKTMGYAEKEYTKNDLNPIPHPFI